MSGIRRGRPPMRGSSRLSPRTPAKSASHTASEARPDSRGHGGAAKKRILFVCVGNSCRSQMAEAFARAYGADIADSSSVGLAAAAIVAPLTRKVLAERNISTDGQFPKGMETVEHQHFDVIVNMSGQPVGVQATHLIRWNVQDPIGHGEEVYRRVAAQIEELVMRLIIEIRSGMR